MNRVLEFFLLRSQLRDAKSRGYGPSDAGYQEYELALLALKDAQQLANSLPGGDTALLLYRSVTRLLIRAALLRGGLAAADATWSELWSRAPQLSAWSGPAPAAAAEVEPSWMTDGLASEDGEAFLAKLSPASRQSALTGLKALAERLATPLAEDATRIRRLLWSRRLRIVLSVLFVACVAAGALVKNSARPNLALNKAVVVSDRDLDFSIDPSAVVDGDRTNLGFHTNARANTSLTIDLGSVTPAARVDVYNRADCCQERATPLLLSISTDGRHFKLVARRTELFQHWIVPLPVATQTRYIRLVHESADFFHLSEVEVY